MARRRPSAGRSRRSCRFGKRSPPSASDRRRGTSARWRRCCARSRAPRRGPRATGSRTQRRRPTMRPAETAPQSEVIPLARSSSVSSTNARHRTQAAGAHTPLRANSNLGPGLGLAGLFDCPHRFSLLDATAKANEHHSPAYPTRRALRLPSAPVMYSEPLSPDRQVTRQAGQVIRRAGVVVGVSILPASSASTPPAACPSADGHR